jgi:hypothetical protein
VLLPFVLWPVYRARNKSYDESGALSQSVLRELRAMNLPDGSVVAIRDENARPNLASTFGSLFPDALALAGLSITVCVEPYEPCQGTTRLTLEKGKLTKH